MSIRTAPGSEWLPASLGSGYQKFVLSLASRLAIWRLSASPRPDAFIIDEGFGACDEENLEAMATALEALASAPGGPRLIFVVSHVETLKARLERALVIESHAAGSRIANAPPRPVAARAPRGAIPAARARARICEPVAAAPDPAAVDPLRPDAANAANVYCDVCRQSLRASWATKHLASAKHAAAAAKAARG